jgi:hypothetical protein
MTGYADFLEHKVQSGGDTGFAPIWTPDFLFPFQRDLVEWATAKGRGLIAADCGLGKTLMQLVWAENVVRKLNKPVLIVTPLAVAWQTVQEGAKFGLEVGYSRDGKPAGDLTVTNYERLEKFDRADYGGCVADESSAIKAFDGTRRQIVTDFLRKMEYRLLCTATAAPNDYTELGTSSEALGELGHMDMLNRFFKNDHNNSATRGGRNRWAGAEKFGAPKWRFKGHAEDPFWRWVASWARAMRKPSDFGFDDDGFLLPPIEYRQHTVSILYRPEGTMFALPAIGLDEERAELRATITERCEMVAQLVNHDQPAVAWCHLNAEGDLLEKLIPGSVQVSGSDSLDAKEEALHAFGAGQVRVLITKPKIGAWGLNWQHCAHTTYFPSHSYEQFYQGIRRFWRFGQTRPVVVDIVTTEGGQHALANLQRKAEQADKMFDRLILHMRDALKIDRTNRRTDEMELPSWL